MDKKYTPPRPKQSYSYTKLYNTLQQARAELPQVEGEVFEVVTMHHEVIEDHFTRSRGGK